MQDNKNDLRGILRKMEAKDTSSMTQYQIEDHEESLMALKGLVAKEEDFQRRICLARSKKTQLAGAA